MIRKMNRLAIVSRETRRLLQRQVSITALALGLAILMLAGCATPYTERYYQLAYPVTTVPSDTVASNIKYELIVGNIRIPDAINRPELVVQKSATESIISDDQRWIAPLDEQIGLALVAHLRSQLPDAWLATSATPAANTASGSTPGAATVIAISKENSAPAPHAVPRYSLTMQVAQLTIQSADKVTLDVTWSLQDAGKKILKRQRTVVNVPISGPGYDPVAPAASEAVRQLSVDIAKGIHATVLL